jgi:hypothetical protein
MIEQNKSTIDNRQLPEKPLLDWQTKMTAGIF